MLDTHPTATVDDLEHDLADPDEVELPLERQNGGSAQATDEEAATAISVGLAPPVEEPTAVGDLDAVALDGLGAHALPAPPYRMRKVNGRYRYTWAAGALRVQVTTPRVPSTSSPAAATMQHITASGRLGAPYMCRYLGSPFRAVVLEGYMVARRSEIAAELGTALE